MKKDFTFEKISNKNFDKFLYLVEKLAEYEKLDPPDDDARLRLKKDGLYRNPKYEAYLTKLDGKYIGYIIYFMTYSSFLALPTLYIEDIFLLKEYRRGGIGQKMFNFCVKKAKEKGCGRLEWCVLHWNKSAIDFYEKNNSKPLKDWIYYRLEKDSIESFSE
jgi:GNAT superfamily N-acetyltransferase